MDVVSKYQYTKIEQIDNNQGKNSLGVYRAFDPQCQHEIAVKEIAKSDFRDPSEYFREAQAMFRSSHPNVVAVRTATQTDDRICLIMPLYRNGSLASRIKSGPLAIRDALRVGQQVLAGTGAIHAAGTVHFDIKPSNVLFSDNDFAMLADFGQSREVGPGGVTLLPDRIYAPSTPPESFTNGRRGTVQSDVYQIGMTLYRAVNGDPVFDEQWAASHATLQQDIERGKFPRRDVFLPHVPDRLRRVIRKAMSVDPSKRYQSCVEFSNSLSRVEIKNNWRAAILPDRSVNWISERDGHPAMQVQLARKSADWGVSIYTLAGSGAQPRRSRTALWKDNLSRTEADRYLTQLFAALE